VFDVAQSGCIIRQNKNLLDKIFVTSGPQFEPDVFSYSRQDRMCGRTQLHWKERDGNQATASMSTTTLVTKIRKYVQPYG
jgi:hypothetical protein